MKYEEYMGFDNLVYAEVTEDSKETFAVGDVKPFAPAGSIKKATPTDVAARSYDNQTYL